MNIEFQMQYEKYLNLVENALHDSIPLPETSWPSFGPPKAVVEAMRYSLLSGGKRIRPVMLLAAYAAFSQQQIEEALPFSVAIEMIHTYSLIHDDLPSMDDDIMRRGKPTCHMVYGEALAILAGDALLNLAYETMLKSSHPMAMQAMKEIALRAGASGMIAGQVADIMLSGTKSDTDTVKYIHCHKTADLLTAPVIAGLILSHAPNEIIKAGKEFGKQVGLAFQITDDLLDISGDPKLIGKPAHRDIEMEKLTWPAVVGVDQAQKDADDAIKKAIKIAESFGKNKGFFQSLARSLKNRVK